MAACLTGRMRPPPLPTSLSPVLSCPVLSAFLGWWLGCVPSPLWPAAAAGTSWLTPLTPCCLSCTLSFFVRARACCHVRQHSRAGYRLEPGEVEDLLKQVSHVCVVHSVAGHLHAYACGEANGWCLSGTGMDKGGGCLGVCAPAGWLPACVPSRCPPSLLLACLAARLYVPLPDTCSCCSPPPPAPSIATSHRQVSGGASDCLTASQFIASQVRKRSFS